MSVDQMSVDQLLLNRRSDGSEYQSSRHVDL